MSTDDRDDFEEEFGKLFDEQDAEPAPPDPDDPFAAIVAGLELEAPTLQDLALILTPIASAEALAGLAVMAHLSCTVVPSRSGAAAAMPLDEADPFLAVSGQPPQEPLALAKAISILTKVDVLLLVTRFAQGEDAAGDGEMTAWSISGEDVTGTVSPGVALMQADPVIEELALGEKDLSEIPGTLDSSTISRAEALRLLSRGVRRRRSE